MTLYGDAILKIDVIREDRNHFQIKEIGN